MSTTAPLRKRILNDVEQVRAWAAAQGTLFETEDARDEPRVYTLRVGIKGPADTPYEGGVFVARVQLLLGHNGDKPYPLSSPSVAFVTPMWHPNIHECGSVCLDVLRDRWLPAIRLVDVFDHYIPHLLRNPEPSDPFNLAAARHLSSDVEGYNTFVRLYTAKHGHPEGLNPAIVLPEPPFRNAPL